MSAARKSRRTTGLYLFAALAGIGTGASGGVLPAQAYTDGLYAYESTQRAPWMNFQKGAAPYGTLYTYYSTMQYGGSQLVPVRRKVTMKAGSGNGSKNECLANQGWLPNGSYAPRYEKNHQTSSTVVRGSVWYVGNHVCSNGSVTRTELFIHSQGANGGSWTEANYKSAGCVKINQIDRTYLASRYNIPVYGASSTTMTVS